MRRRTLLAGAAAALAAPVAAQSMNAELFLQRANKLKAKGAMAVFSGGEIKTLMREGQAAGKAAAAIRKADKAAGRPARPGRRGGRAMRPWPRPFAVPVASASLGA